MLFEIEIEPVLSGFTVVSFFPGAKYSMSSQYRRKAFLYTPKYAVGTPEIEVPRADTRSTVQSWMALTLSFLQEPPLCHGRWRARKCSSSGWSPWRKEIKHMHIIQSLRSSCWLHDCPMLPVTMTDGVFCSIPELIGTHAQCHVGDYPCTCTGIRLGEDSIVLKYPMTTMLD